MNNATEQTALSTDALHSIARWGYVYDRPCPVAGVGYRRLVIAIRNQPTHRHYDPEQIDVPDRESDGRYQRISLHGAGVRSFGLGKIRLMDRFEKRQDFWTFGGTVTTMPLKDGVAYIFESDAPFLPMDRLHPDSNYYLAVELKALFGRIQADVHRQGISFSQWVRGNDPRTVYLGSLASVSQMYQKLAGLEPHRVHLRRALQRTLTEAGRYQEVVPLEAQIRPAQASAPVMATRSPLPGKSSPRQKTTSSAPHLTPHFTPA
jgi:hypothetical protein